MSLLSLANAKLHLNFTDTDDDAELQWFIDACESAIGDRVGPLTPVSKTERLDGGGRTMTLISRPVASLTSVTAVYSGNVLTLSDLHLDHGVITYNNGFPFIERAYDVVFMHGWANPTSSLMHVIRDMVKHFWDTQRGQGGSGRRRSSDQQIAEKIAGAAYMFTYRVEAGMAPHKPILVY